MLHPPPEDIVGSPLVESWKCQYQVHLINFDYTKEKENNNNNNNTHISLHNKFTSKYGVFPRIILVLHDKTFPRTVRLGK
jgi:hypothetical protein